MPITWQVILRSSAGAVVATFDQWPEWTFTREVNAAGGYGFHINGDDPRVALFTDDCQLEFWTQDPENGIPWRKEFEAFHSDYNYYTDASGARHFESMGKGYNDLLDRTINESKAGSAGSAKSGAAETVIKAYVNEQAGPGAGARARSGLVIQADAASGNAIDLQRSYRNLLEVCRDVSAIGGGDFEIVGMAILNGGFEVLGAGGGDVFAEWMEVVTPGSASPVDETVDVYSGQHAVKLENNGVNPCYVWQFIPALPGAVLDLTLATHGDGAVSSEYMVYDATNAAFIVPLTTTGVVGTTYIRKTFQFAVPAGCYSAWLGLMCPSVPGTAWFDDVTLRPTLATGQMFIFRWHAGQLGADRRGNVVFSEGYGNMAEPRLEVRRSHVRNAALVAAYGEAAARYTVWRTDAASIALSPWGRREVLVDAREVDDGNATAAADKGDAALAENRATVGFSFKPLQSPGSLYGKNYFLGDLVTARYQGVDYDRKIQSVTISNGRMGQTVDVQTVAI
jgi:hypothetical protein